MPCPNCNFQMDTLDSQCPRCHGDPGFQAKQAKIAEAKRDQQTFKRIVIGSAVLLVCLGGVLLGRTGITARNLKEANAKSATRAAHFAEMNKQREEALAQAETRRIEEANTQAQQRRQRMQESQGTQQPQAQPQEPQEPQQQAGGWQPCSACGGRGQWSIPCTHCHGTGFDKACDQCGGKGTLTSYGQSMSDMSSKKCPTCNGAGTHPCTYCGGGDHDMIVTCYACNASGYVYTP